MKKRMCFVTCCFKIISFSFLRNKAIPYDNGHTETWRALFFNLENKFLLIMDACQFQGVSLQLLVFLNVIMLIKCRMEGGGIKGKELVPKSATCNYIPQCVYNYIHFTMCLNIVWW